MKFFLISAITLMSSISAYANGITPMKNALDAVEPLLLPNEQVFIARRTWAVHENGPEWKMYVFSNQKGNFIITLTKDLRLVQRVACPQEGAPSICEL